MNKKILAAAIAATVVAPAVVAADVTVYGKLHTAIDMNDSATANTDTTDVTDRGSRLGFKGSEDLGNGLKANFQIEMTADVTEGGTALRGTTTAPLTAGRNTYVGLSGDFGEFRIGHHDSPSKMAAGSLSTFHDQIGDINQTGNITNLHATDAVAYISPSMGGFTVAAAILPGAQWGSGALGVAGNNHDGFAEAYSIGAFYDNGGISVRGWFEDADDAAGAGNDLNNWGIAGRYKMDNLYVSAWYQDQEGDTDASTAGWRLGNDIETYAIEGGYTMGNTTIKALWTDVELDDNNPATVDQDQNAWAIGVDHKLSKRTMVYAQYADVDQGTNNAASATINSTGTNVESAFSLGLMHSF